MTNDEALTEAIQLIKAGNKEAARSLLEPFLLNNPHHIQAWLWETELFPNDRDKIKVLEACLKQNPGEAQVIKALMFFKKRADLNLQPAAPATSSYSPPPPVYPEPRPSSYRAPAPDKPESAASPFSAPLDLPDPVISAPAPRPTVTGAPPVERPGQPQPAFQKKAALQKKSKPMTPAVRNIILAIFAFIAFIVVFGLYLGGGYYLNGQINQSFASQNCADVVQQTAFVSLYPRGIFASIFTGHDQYAQCRIKLDVEQAAAVKNWGGAVSLCQQYLTAYPNGTFAKSLSDQAPKFLSTWGEELIANHNYTNGIEKLKQLLQDYPDSTPAQSASDTILQTYILWTKELSSKQNFKEAEPLLKAALSYFKIDSVRSEQITQELVNLYMAWGDAQVQAGDTDSAINTYKKAGDTSPGKTDVELLIAKAYLQKALDISKTKNFDKALAKVKEVSDAAQAENIKIAANATREEILIAYSMSTAPQAMEQMTAAINLTCQGQRTELPIFGLDPEKIRFGFIHAFVTLPAEWAAERPGELRYVICSTETEEHIQTCKYTGGFSLARMRYTWQTQLYDLLSGEKVASKNIKGSDPTGCPSQALFLAGSSVSRSYGKRPTVDDFVTWLTQLNLTK